MGHYVELILIHEVEACTIANLRERMIFFKSADVMAELCKRPQVLVGLPETRWLVRHITRGILQGAEPERLLPE